MDVAALQRLFDSLGPIWRVFVYDEGQDESAMAGVAPFVRVLAPEPEGFMVEFPFVDGDGFWRVIIDEPVPVSSPLPGTVLQAGRYPNGGRVVFSTATLTPVMRKAALEFAALTFPS